MPVHNGGMAVNIMTWTNEIKKIGDKKGRKDNISVINVTDISILSFLVLNNSKKQDSQDQRTETFFTL